MRLVVVEKKKRGDRSAIQFHEGVFAAGVEESDSRPTTAASNTQAQPEPQEEKTVSFAGWKLLKQPRVVITLWALGMDGLITGAADAVGHAHPLS
jgi:hypothetical protein